MASKDNTSPGFVRGSKLFGVTQPRISNLVRGRIDLFSIDTLVGMLARAGIHVEVIFSSARKGAA
jgi:predicted XRE-type DNA-binding protein